MGLLVLLGVVGACGRPEPADRLPLVEALPTLAMHEVARIHEEVPASAWMADVRAVAESPTGDLYVLYGTMQRVVRRQVGGRALLAFGAEGRGPGEFESPVALGVVGDTLWVSDTALERITLFSLDGELLEVVAPQKRNRLLVEGVVVRLLPGHLRRDGTVGSRWSITVPPWGLPGRFSVPHVRMNRNGEVIDTLAVVSVDFPPGTQARVSGRMIPVPPPPSFGPLQQYHETGLLVVEMPRPKTTRPQSFRTVRTDESGDTVFDLRLGYTPRRFPDDYVHRRIADALAPQVRWRGVDHRLGQAALRRELRLPRFQPAVSRVKICEDGTTLLRGPVEAGGHTRWIMLSPEGHVHGVIRLSESATVHWCQGPVLWIETPDVVHRPVLTRFVLPSVAP